MTKTIIIPEEVSTAIEAAQLNYETRQDLCSFMINRNVDIHGESFQAYEAQLCEFKAEYELRKRAMEEEYIKPECKRYSGWKLDFGTHTVTVTME